MTLQSFFSDYVLFAGYILVGLAALAAVGGPIMIAISNPKSMIRSGIGIGIFAVIYLIGRTVSSSEVSALYQKFDITANLSNQIGAMLFIMYTLFIIAVLAIIVNEILNLLK